MRYLLITSAGLSGGLQAPAHELAEVFRAHGRDVDLLHIGDSDFAPRLQTLLAERRPDLALSWGGFGDRLTWSVPNEVEQNLWGALRIPFLKIIHDVHAYNPAHHHVRGGFQVLSYAFKDHAVLRSRYTRPIPGERGPMITWLPQLLPLLPGGAAGAVEDPTLYFHKNGNSSAALEQSWRGFPRPLREALHEIGRVMHDDIDRAFVIRVADAVAAYLAEYDPDRHLLLPFRDFILAQIDDYIRRLKGEMLVRQLKDLPVVVNGHGWGYLRDQLTPRRLRFIEAADHFDTSRRIRSSLGTIDISPNVDLAIHERTARAIAFGHGLLEYDNQFARDHRFPHTFKLADGSLPALAGRLLSDPAAADEFREFRAGFVAGHTPAAALDHFEECAAMVAFANSRDPGIADYIWWPML